MPETRGRPRLPASHGDDAMMATFATVDLLRRLRRMRAEHYKEQGEVALRHYREQRALIEEMEEQIVSAAGSWRLAEIVSADLAAQHALLVRADREEVAA